MNYVSLVIVVPCNARNSTLFRLNPLRDSSPTGVLYCVTKEESQSVHEGASNPGPQASLATSLDHHRLFYYV